MEQYRLISATLLPLLLLACLNLYATKATAEVALIVHPSHKLSKISSDLASAIYLGVTKALPDGTIIEPIDQEDDEPSRDKFHQLVTRKDKFQYKAHWYRLAFTGKGLPPETVADNEEMIELISTSTEYIGYVDVDAIPNDQSVKVLLRTQGYSHKAR